MTYEEFYALPSARRDLFWHIIGTGNRFDTMNDKLALIGFEIVPLRGPQ